MRQSSSVRFARTVHALGVAARGLGLDVPGFRSPPRLVGVHRSIKRGSGGSTVAVTVRDRPWPAVQADLIEGVIAANRLTPPAADRARADLWAALEALGAPVSPSQAGNPGRPPAGATAA